MKASVTISYSAMLDVPDLEGLKSAKKQDVLRFLAARYIHNKLREIGFSYHVQFPDIPYSGGFVTIKEADNEPDGVSEAERSDGERSDGGVGGGHQDTACDPGPAD